MATLEQLVEVVANREGMDPATVRLIARYVREAGLIRTGGRGLSAYQMEYTDAANLLIGVNASASAQDAPAAVRRFRRLEVWAEGNRSGTFGEALDTLIEALATNRTLPQMFLRFPIPAVLSQKRIRDVEVKFERPYARAGLSISLGEGFRRPLDPSEVYISCRELFGLRTKRANKVGQIYFDFILEKLLLHPDGTLTEKDGTPFATRRTDRRDTTVIGWDTVNAVARALKGENLRLF